MVLRSAERGPGQRARTRISYLDQSLQEQLHLFYELVITHNYNQEPEHTVIRGGLPGPTDGDGGPRRTKPELETAIASVKEFLRKNGRDRRRLLKLFWAYDGDDWPWVIDT